MYAMKKKSLLSPIILSVFVLLPSQSFAAGGCNFGDTEVSSGFAFGNGSDGGVTAAGVPPNAAQFTACSNSATIAENDANEIIQANCNLPNVTYVKSEYVSKIGMSSDGSDPAPSGSALCFITIQKKYSCCANRNVAPPAAAPTGPLASVTPTPIVPVAPPYLPSY